MELNSKMKRKKRTIKEIREDQERQKREFVKRMEYEKHKRGITKQKLDYVRVKERKYVRDMNEMYSVIDPTKHIEITTGSVNEGKRYCTTKSHWQWEHEQNPENWEKPEREKEHKPERRKEKIMLRIKDKIFVVEAWITPYEKETYAEMKLNGQEYEAWIEMEHLEEEKEYETPYGVMTGKMIMEVSLATATRIYREE